MKVMILVRGLPGSGKSTLAVALQRKFNNDDYDLYVRKSEADAYFVRPDGRYDFNGNLIKQAHSWCFKGSVAGFLNGEKHVSIVSNTFTTNKEMYNYAEFCRVHNVKLVVVRCIADFGSIHDVPDEVIERMKNRFESSEHCTELFFDGHTESVDQIYMKINNHLKTI